MVVVVVDVRALRWQCVWQTRVGVGGGGLRVRAPPHNTPYHPAACRHPFTRPQVHVTADGECVVFHDFLVPLRLGTEVVRLPIPTLSYAQLSSHDFTQWMAAPK